MSKIKELLSQRKVELDRDLPVYASLEDGSYTATVVNVCEYTNPKTNNTTLRIDLENIAAEDNMTPAAAITKQSVFMSLKDETAIKRAMHSLLQFDCDGQFVYETVNDIALDDEFTKCVGATVTVVVKNKFISFTQRQQTNDLPF